MNNQQKIPEGWKELSFNQVVSEVIDFRGKTPKKLGMDWGGGSIPALSANNVKKGYIDFGSECHLASEELYKKWMNKGDLKQGDIIFTMEAPLGNVAIVPDNNKYILSQRVVALRPSEGVDNIFLFHYLLSDVFQGLLDLLSTGSTAKGVNQKSLSMVKFLVPKLAQQRQIVQILETWDKYISLLNQKIKIKKYTRYSLLQKLTSGDLFKKVTKVKIKDICDISRGGSPRPIEQFITKDSDGYNWLRIGDIENDAMYIQSTSEKIIPEGLKKTTLVNPGDFILSNSMSFGRPYIMKISACIHDGWLALRNIKTNVDKFFLFYLLTSDKMQNTFKSLAAGSGVRNLKKEIVAEITINFPDLEEQKHIAKLLLTSDEEISFLKKQKNLVVKQKNYLLNNLITGQIRVPEFTNKK